MTLDAFREHLARFVPELGCDDRIVPGPESPLAAPLDTPAGRAGNRFTIHPMEGWDGTGDGRPGDLTRERWRRFGLSGAKVIWGGEAVAVRPEGRANPNQLCLTDASAKEIGALRELLVRTHAERFGSAGDLIVGLQLTHSGRFCRPNAKDRAEPRIAYRHPILDARVGATDAAILTDAEIDGLIADFVRASRRAQELGFDFVDIKHCHGYLLHEFLGAHTRPGPYGGSFENRTRLLREIAAGIGRDAPGLAIGVRASVFDLVPFRPGAESEVAAPRAGVPEDTEGHVPYRYGFGVDAADPTRPDVGEAHRLLALFEELGIRLVNVTGGSPYYNPHIQRPALYPPSDGYGPPEDPLAGVARHLRITRELRERAAPGCVVIGSALTYLQDWLPHVAQALVRDGWMDSVGIGRMVLSYWDLPADVLERGELQRKRVCRTFSDCTTAPRSGLVSGCYPLDPLYRDRPEADALRAAKRG